jgi:hypothetical protein
MLDVIDLKKHNKIFEMCLQDYGESLSEQMKITLNRMKAYSLQNNTLKMLEYKNENSKPLMWIAFQEDRELHTIQIPFYYMKKGIPSGTKRSEIKKFIIEFKKHVEKYENFHIFLMAIPIVADVLRSLMVPPFIEKCCIEDYFEYEESVAPAYLFVKKRIREIS